VNLGSFTFLCAVAYRGWKNGKVPKCAAGRVGKKGLKLRWNVMIASDFGCL